MSATTSPQRPTSFAQRRINVAFQFSSADTVTLTGRRVSAAITNQGGVMQGQLDLRVYGLTESVMNQLSQVPGLPVQGNFRNVVTVTAGTDATGLAVAFQGNISGAFADYQGSPDVPFHVTCLGALSAAVKSVPPSSYKGGADAAVVMADLARLMGVKFENNGVSGIVLSNPYYPGTAYQQMESCREEAGIEAHVVDGTLAIWPRGGSRGGAVPLISAETGMVGYPVRTSIGLEVTTLYNPAIAFGAKVKVQSPSVPQACGIWQVHSLAHVLESETPDGAWFSYLSCGLLGYIPTS